MLEDQVKEAEYYKTMLEFRKGKKGLRTSKLFFFRDDLSSPPTVSNLLEKLERMFFSYQEVEERNFEGNGRNFLENMFSRELVQLREAFYFPTLSVCTNQTTYFLETGWQNNLPTSQVLVANCYFFAGFLDKKKELWLPSFLGMTKSGQTRCPVCSWSSS